MTDDIIGTHVARVIPEGWHIPKGTVVLDDDVYELMSTWTRVDHRVVGKVVEPDGKVLVVGIPRLVIRRNAPVVEPSVEEKESRKWQKRALAAEVENLELDDRKQELRAHIVELKAKVAELEKELAQMKSQSCWARTAEAEAEVYRLQGQVSDASAVNEVLHDKVQKAEAEVARMRFASVAETQRFIDEVKHHQETADVAMRRKLAAEEQMKDLRALCGETAKVLDDPRCDCSFTESRHALVVRLREVAKEVTP